MLHKNLTEKGDRDAQDFHKSQEEEDSDKSAWKGAEYFRLLKWFRGPGQAGKIMRKNKTLIEKRHGQTQRNTGFQMV